MDGIELFIDGERRSLLALHITYIKNLLIWHQNTPSVRKDGYRIHMKAWELDLVNEQDTGWEPALYIDYICGIADDFSTSGICGRWGKRPDEAIELLRRLDILGSKEFARWFCLYAKNHRNFLIHIYGYECLRIMCSEYGEGILRKSDVFQGQQQHPPAPELRVENGTAERETRVPAHMAYLCDTLATLRNSKAVLKDLKWLGRSQLEEMTGWNANNYMKSIAGFAGSLLRGEGAGHWNTHPREGIEILKNLDLLFSSRFARWFDEGGKGLMHLMIHIYCHEYLRRLSIEHTKSLLRKGAGKSGTSF